MDALDFSYMYMYRKSVTFLMYSVVCNVSLL